ncbi:DUF2802 domain-containing protein [Rheinheimera baltica]|uniref:DUF2802 domain-containing protein n=1 Tax=Rheinheimera baltica TaxID=67576 RepID=A0ABT9HVP9_9GAMM|nr:DUF2802 domain-containing protein [Rheinheimera baltica]MDP5134895.1 DUF2802 domain-containing protein [Rheinheimera baltica]MDP5143143.1 DUF2802 domain-containing protein [Rheinheimera baltica]MDP5149853.1 DUF2802 domain-containing protein [Rheinheimera baltica]MDP5189791.1 DUF2802 domain-containing protein [Rheinheimera baltica]
MWLSVVIQTALLLVLAFFTFLWCRRYQQSVTKQLNELEKRLEYSAQQQQQSQLDVEELRAGIIGVGQRVLQLDAALTELNDQLNVDMQALADKQQALQLTDPESKIYSRAMKMVKLGADLDEIIRECELPRAEAELLFNLHQQNKQF